MPGGASGGGTGSNLTKATVIVCGVASLVASLLSFLYDVSKHIGFVLLFLRHDRLANILRSQISMATNVRSGYTSCRYMCVDEGCRKNYRKPLLQRYVIRILLMYVDISYSGASNLLCIRVPVYSASSWASIMSQDAAFYLDPLRDIYEVRPAKPQGSKLLD